MKYATLIIATIAILFTQSLYASDLFGDQVPVEASEIVSDLDKSLDKAFKSFIKDMDKEISKADKNGDVGLSQKLREAKNSVLSSRHFTELGEAAEDEKAVAIKLSSSWLKDQFNAAKASVDKRGVVTLVYEFKSTSEVHDFDLGGQDIKLEKGQLNIGPKMNVKHKAIWDGDIEVVVEASYDNWLGNYLSVGGNTINTKQYKSAWFIQLGSSESIFSKDIKQSGNPDEFRTLTYTLTGSRTIVDYGKMDNTPVTFATMGGKLDRDSITLYGADGGAHIRLLVIKGMLNMEKYLE